MTTRRGQPRRPPVRAVMLCGVAVLWCATAALMLAGASWWALAGGLPALMLGIGLVAYLLLARTLVAVTVRGASMEPAYQDGDWVLVRRDLPPAPGQVVVVEQPEVHLGWSGPQLPDAVSVPRERWLVKRVAAVPGDPVPRDRVPALVDVPEDRVPPGKLVLLGDNREVSLDSRWLGYFSAERVLGVVVRRLGFSTAGPATVRSAGRYGRAWHEPSQHRGGRARRG